MCVVLLRVLVAFWLETLTTCLATQQAAGAGVAQRGWSSAADAAMMEDNSPTVIKMKGIELKGRPLYLDMQVTEPLCRGIHSAVESHPCYSARHISAETATSDDARRGKRSGSSAAPPVALPLAAAHPPVRS